MAKPRIQKEDNQTGIIGRTSGFARYLSPIDAWAIAFGCIVGWGAFVMPGTTFLPVAGPAGTTIALLIGAFIMLIIGANYSYLMKKRPGAGGVYAYTREAFGKDHAFLCSWFLSLSYISIVFMNATAIFIMTRTLFGDALHFGYHYNVAGFDVYLTEIGLSTLILLILSSLFILVKPLPQYLLTISASVLLIGSLIVAAACLPRVGSIGDLFAFSPKGDVTGVVFAIVLLAPWAYVGFDTMSLETVHFKFDIRRSGKLIALSIICGAVVYIVMSLISVTAVPDSYSSWMEYFADLNNLKGIKAVPTFYAAESAMGSTGVVIIGATAAAAILTGIIAAFKASIRMLTSMADDMIVSGKFANTTFCVIFILVLSVFVSFLGRNTLEWFVELTTFGAIIGFGYTSLSAFKLAKAEGNRRVTITGIAGTLISIAFIVMELVPELTSFQTMSAESFLALSLWCILGFAVYWRSMKRSVLQEYNGAAVSSTVLFALLLYSAMMWFLEHVIRTTGSEELRNRYRMYGVIFVIIVTLGLGVMMYIENLLRKRQNELSREVIRAEESNHAKSRFLFNMSHDIRTPMNAIIGFTNLAKKENPEGKMGEYLNKIDRSSRNLLGLINDVLEMSRIENGVAELSTAPADICEIFDTVRDLFSNQMESKNLDFIVDTSGVKNRYVICDSKSLNRAVVNIVGNAYKFTPEGGIVSVTLNEIACSEEGKGSYHLRIRDTGMGMSPEFAVKVFTAFERERTDAVSEIQGTGLGMAITKNIIDLMGGTIEVRTAPGEGTEFELRFTLPLCAAEDVGAPEAAVAEKDEKLDFTKIRLLLVEDNLINMEIASVILSENGFLFDIAGDGKQALDMVAESYAGYYDAVLMDIRMPVMDGYEAAAAIRALDNKALASVPIIAMTAGAVDEDAGALSKAGMQGFIAKPIEVNKMLSTLTRILEKNKVRSDKTYGKQ